MEDILKPRSESYFVKVLETDSLSDIALIKAVLDTKKIQYFIQGENMIFIRPVDPAVLMVEEGDMKKVLNLLKPLKLNFNRIIFDRL
jgi:hypothetical protein